jgi:hypothetical protein
MKMFNIKYCYMQLVKILFLLFFILLINECLSQPFPVNRNLNFTLDVIEVGSRHLIIPHLKVLKDTQDIKIQRGLTFGNEFDLNVSCQFYLQKIIKKKLVNMYLNKLYFPDEDNKFEKFTTKNSLSDTMCIEDYIPLEPGQYVISLELNYYLNGAKAAITSNEASFFVADEQKIKKGMIRKDGKKF